MRGFDALMKRSMVVEPRYSPGDKIASLGPGAGRASGTLRKRLHAEDYTCIDIRPGGEPGGYSVRQLRFARVLSPVRAFAVKRPACPPPDWPAGTM